MQHSLGSSPAAHAPCCTLFIEDDKRTSVIAVVNSAPDALNMDVVLYGLSGEELARQGLSVGPHAQQTVAVADLLQNSTAQYGSVFLVPHRNTTMGLNCRSPAGTVR